MDYHCEILFNGVLQGPYRRIVFRAPELAAAAAPGQFVHVRIPACRDRILRRPFSICSADPEAGSLTIVYKIVGEGTGELSRMAPGEFCNVMGPLGHGYTLPGEDTFPILVAGGYGSASTLFLAERSPRKGVLLTGARSADDLILLEEYRKIGYRVLTATNDGSAGRQGLVTELLPEALSLLPEAATAFCYACGPAPMLYALGPLTLKSGLRTELSLDQHMCCGVGACFACVVKVKDDSSPDKWRYSRSCKEGPVYSAEELYYG